MEKKQVVSVRVFQSMELEWDGHSIKNEENRSQKLWLILAYIILSGQNGATQDGILSTFWEGSETGPGVLKTALHRIRTMLAESFGETFAKEFICCQKKTYTINESYTVVCDAEEFENYVRLARQTKNTDEQLNLYKKAFELYRGEFLSVFSDTSWVTPLHVYYRNLYLEVICSILEICEKKQEYEEVIELLQRAGKIVKYEESLYVYLMRYLMRMEKYSDVMNVYRQLSEMLEERLDAKPSEEAKSLYYEAMYASSTRLANMEEVISLVERQDADREAMYCELDFFKELYHAYCNGLSRNQQRICLAMIDITDIQDRLLSKRSLSCCVANLKEVLCKNLRAGDIISMCSPCQFVLLLPNALEADVKRVMERVKKVYFKKYVHSPAKLTCYVKSVAAGEKR